MSAATSTRTPDESFQAAHFPRLCTCCRAPIPCLDAWRSLPLRGLQVVPDYVTLEFRDCACGSTLSIHLYPPESE